MSAIQVGQRVRFRSEETAPWADFNGWPATVIYVGHDSIGEYATIQFLSGSMFDATPDEIEPIPPLSWWTGRRLMLLFTLVCLVALWLAPGRAEAASTPEERAPFLVHVATALTIGLPPCEGDAPSTGAGCIQRGPGYLVAEVNLPDAMLLISQESNGPVRLDFLSDSITPCWAPGSDVCEVRS